MWLLLLLLIVAAFYALLKHIYSYWERREFPAITASIPAGNMSALIKRQASFGITIVNLYDKTTEPFIGIYLFFRPALLVRDAHLAKKMLTVDFPSFHDRGVHSNEKTNPLSANLFNSPGEKWKNMRQKLSPTFTSGKLKKMFTTFNDVGDAMLNHLQDVVPKDGKTIDLRKLTTMYASDVIGSAFFGLDINSFKDPENKFLKLRELGSRGGFISSIALASLFLCPKLFDMLQLYRINSDMNRAFIDLVKETFEYRDKYNETRKDFMQLLLQLRNTGAVKEDGDWNAQATAADGKKSLSIEECAAQAFIFYIAGLETTAATVSFCLYEVARDKDVKEKLLKDINETLERHNGELTYDSINEMKYLELCVLETIRKYPGLPILNRECTKAYQIPETKYIIEPGTAIVIPLLGIHRNPEYFPEPLKFMPERFLEGQRNYVEDAYLPFGEGPRTCIGLRQGKLSAKVALVKILTSFKVDCVEDKELEFDNFSVGLVPRDGAYVKLMKIE